MRCDERSKLSVILVSFVFQVFSRSDPISFTDVATCDWLNKLSDLKNLQIQFLDLTPIFSKGSISKFFFPNQTLGISIEIPHESSNVIIRSLI